MELPATGHAFEFVLPPIHEHDTRPGNKVLDSARHEDFARRCQGSNASGDVNAKAAQVVTSYLAFARMQTEVQVGQVDVPKAMNEDQIGRARPTTW